LNILTNYPSPVWILLFPEGTRFNKEKYAASCQFAEERGLPVLKRCLVPRTKGFTFTIANIDPSKVPWLYDVTLACDSSNPATAPTLTNVLLGRPTIAHMFIRRFKVKDIPREEEEAAKWLKERFVETDQLLDTFHTSGKFPESESVPDEMFPRRPWCLILSAVINLSVWVPILNHCLFCGGWGSIIGLGAMIGMSMVGIKYFISITQIKHSSNYGKKEK